MFLAPFASAQEVNVEPAGKQAHAVRVRDGSIRIDGLIDEDAWDLAVPVTNFVQKEPIEGAPPSEKMEVRFLYDDSVLYVGAKMWSADPGNIQAPLGRRDDAAQAEHITASFDTHRDRLTAYTFGVTASGVRIDRFHPRDDEDAFDLGFDPVWDARTAITEWGWTAELWIPFSQLRFIDQREQIWGLNIHRFIPSLNERNYWVAIPRTVTAWASRFGELHGLERLRAARRLELLPYIAASTEVRGNRTVGDPFDDGRNLASRVGLDLKMGLGPSLTLEATVNPDFGQVEADPAEVNLSAFETIFPEKRQFFTESARLLNLEVQTQLFNSRRIGQRPTGPVSGDYIDYPDSSTIISAAKITGRTASGTSVGILGAVTDQESAKVSNIGSPSIADVKVAPRTMYGVGRIQQEFGRAGSTVSVMATAVHRDLQPQEPLAQFMARNVYSGGGDTILRLKGGEYEVRAGFYGTYLVGEPAAIARVQRSAVHFLQRPDRETARLDPTRTTLPGYRTEAGIVRRSGRHWLWDTNAVFESPGMEPNDIGRTSNTDNMINNTNVRYRETRPGRIFRTYTLTLTTRYELNYDRDVVGRWFRPSVSATFNNFWTASGSFTKTFRALNPALTRGGPLMQRPASWSATASLATPSTSQTRMSGSVSLSGSEDGGRSRRANGSFSFHFGPRWRLAIDPSFDHTIDDQQYVTTLSEGGSGTFGSRYLFAYIDRHTLSTEIRAAFTLKPNVNVDVYAEPFASSGRYDTFGELLRARERARLTYGTMGTTEIVTPNGDRTVTTADGTFTIANRDFNVRSLRGNVVLRWEWRPGSTLYLVWQQDRSLREIIGTRAGLGDLLGSLTAPGTNVLAIKTSFWLPVR